MDYLTRHSTGPLPSSRPYSARNHASRGGEMARRLIALVFGLVLVPVAQLGVATAASGKGIPVTGLSPDSGGLTAPGSDDRYVVLEATEGTVLARLAQDGGEVIEARSLRDRLTTPPVALDGTPGGLSADGRTLVLVPPR